MQELETVDAETLINNPLNEVEYVIEDILPMGLHLFCGASKIGKSWLMLKICLQVSTGQTIWELKTKECDVLYLCLEDTIERIQKRLFKLTDEASRRLHFAVSTNKISDGLVFQLETFLSKNKDTKLIIIDTLQKIRNQSKDNAYASDYGDISVLKTIADKYKIAIIVVHHIRKQTDSDVFNKVSGTTGIMGSSDSTFILDKKSREDSTATLFITGRDIEYQEFILKFENDTCNWELISRSKQKELEEKKTPDVIFKIIEFMENKEIWKGSATELLKELNVTNIAPTIITKIINEYHFSKLKENNIYYSLERNNKGRYIILNKRNGDNGDKSDNKANKNN